MSWGWYEMGRSSGYAEGKANAERAEVIIDYSAINSAYDEVDHARAMVSAYRRAIASHTDGDRLERLARAMMPRVYIGRRFARMIGGMVKLAGWLLALNLIGSALFGY